MENRSALMKDMEEKIQNICIELSKYDVETIVISVDVKNKVSNSYGSKIACEFLNLKRNLTKQLLNFILEYHDQHEIVYKQCEDDKSITRVDISNNYKDKTENPSEDTDPEDDSSNFSRPEVSSRVSRFLDKNQLDLSNPMSKGTENVICESINSINGTFPFQKIQQIQNNGVPSHSLQYSSLSQKSDLINQGYSPSQLQSNLNVKFSKMSSDINARGTIGADIDYNNTMETSGTFVLQSSVPLEQNQFEQNCSFSQHNSSLRKSCDADSEHYICGKTERTDTVIIMAEHFPNLKHFSSGSFLYLDEIGIPSDMSGKIGGSKDYHSNITIDIISDQEGEALDHQVNSVENKTSEENVCSQEMCTQNIGVTTNKYEDLSAVQNRGARVQSCNLEQRPLLINFHNQPETRSDNSQNVLMSSYAKGGATKEMTGLINIHFDTDQDQGQERQKNQTISDAGKLHVQNLCQDQNISIESVRVDTGREERAKVQDSITGIHLQNSNNKNHGFSELLQSTVNNKIFTASEKMTKDTEDQKLSAPAVPHGNYQHKVQSHMLDNHEIFLDVKATKKKSFNKDTELVDVFGRQPYKCSICGVRFTKLKNLYSHKKKMHAPGVIKFRCENCGTSYRSQESLDKHNLLHSIVEGTETMIKCNVNGRVREAQKGQDKSRESLKVNHESENKCRDSQNFYIDGNNREQNQCRSTKNYKYIKENKEMHVKSRDDKNAVNNYINIGDNQMFHQSEQSNVKNLEKSLAFDDNKDKSYDTDNFQSCDLDNASDLDNPCDKTKKEISPKLRIMTRAQSNHKRSSERLKKKSMVSKVEDTDLNHFEAEPKVHQCEICQSSFSRLKNLKEHLKKIHNLFFKCTYCTLTFASKELLSKHQSENCGNKGLKCIVCGKIFAKRYNMLRHMTMIHSNEEKFECEKCNKTFKTKDGLKRHVNTHLTTYKCTECRQEFLLYIEMVRHKAAAHKKEQLLLICSICRKQFPSHHRLVVHLRTHSAEKPYECCICQKRYKSNESLKHHKLSHLRSKSHLCDVCGKDFIHKTSLVIHKKSHNKGRYAKCQYCNKVLASQEGLHSHMVAFHSSHVDFKNRTYHHCKECSKIFTDKHRFLKHKLIHTGEKPFKCDICKKCFNHPRNLKTHINKHNNIKSYSCKDCGNTFTYKKDLLRHVKYNYCQAHRDLSMTESPAESPHVKVALEYS